MGLALLETSLRGEVEYLEASPLHLKGSLPERLERIFLDVRALVSRVRPDVIAVEEIFHGRSFDSALKLGQARGVVLLVAQMARVELCEYAPANVKKTVTGNGNASKEQVQRMVQRRLGLASAPTPMDVSDALAIGVCCAETLARAWRLEGRRMPQVRSAASSRLREVVKGEGKRQND